MHDSAGSRILQARAHDAVRQPPAASVVVCTFNRCDRLRESLRAIGRACRDRSQEVEILVVDNNSSDATGEVVGDFARTSVVPVRYVFEERQGLSHARNRGMREARGRIVAFTDDDCLVDPDWLSVVLDEFDRHPDIALIGGRVDLHNPHDRPVTIRPIAQRVRYSRLEHVFTLAIGCNFAFRREIADRVGWFDPVFGGTNGIVADDIDFVFRVYRLGLGVEFVPGMRVSHDHGRRSDDEIDRLNAAYVRGRGAFYAKHALRGDGAVMRTAALEILSEFRLLARTLVAGKPITKNVAFLCRLLSGAWRQMVSRPAAHG